VRSDVIRVRQRRALVKRIAGRGLRKLPESWRASLATRFPQLPVSKPIIDQASAYDRAYWQQFYATPDPWRLTESDLEPVKYDLTLALAGEGPFTSALEIGCGEGLFTRRLAPRCSELLAVDIAASAVARARERCSNLPNVVCAPARLPAEYPEGPFDLVVASDVLYYWTPTDLTAAIPTIEASLAPGGHLVALHYSEDLHAVSNGHAVHDTLADQFALNHTHSEIREIGHGRTYRVDAWEKSSQGAS